MKPVSLIVKNIGPIGDASIPFAYPLIMFYGEPRAGKTTILNCIRWVCGGGYPEDVLKHGAQEGKIALTLDHATISREFYRAADGAVKDRGVVLVRDGAIVKKPVAEIAKLLNPFLLNQDHFRQMGETERKQFLVSVLGVKTDDLDGEAVKVEADARDLRSKIKGYGDIDLTPVKPVDMTALREARTKIVVSHAKKAQVWRAELAKVEADHQAEVERINAENAAGIAHNAACGVLVKKIADAQSDITELESRLATRRENLKDYQAALKANPELPLKVIPSAPITTELRARINTPPDTAKLDADISAAAANEVRYQQYQAAVAREQQRQNDRGELVKLEARTKEIKGERVARLASVSVSSGIAELSFDDAGNVVYEGTQMGMLSTSQVMRLQKKLEGLYPEGLGLSIVDRAESMGRSVFEFVAMAQERHSTILATVVGEKPADIPENVGVFMVEAGKVTKEN